MFELYFTCKIFAYDSKSAEENVIKNLKEKLGLDEKTIKDSLTIAGANLNSSNLWMKKHG